jgi:hypothetical protein
MASCLHGLALGYMVRRADAFARRPSSRIVTEP